MSYYDDWYDVDDIVKKKFTKKEKKIYDRWTTAIGEQEKQLMQYEQHSGVQSLMWTEHRLNSLGKKLDEAREQIELLTKQCSAPPQYVPPPVYGPTPPKDNGDILNLLSGKKLKDGSKNDST